MANKNVDFESMASDIMFSKTSERKLIEKFGVHNSFNKVINNYK